MKRPTYLILSLLLVAVTICACLLGIGAYRDQFTDIRGVFYLKTSPRLDLSGQPLENLEQLRQFPALEWVDLRGT